MILKWTVKPVVLITIRPGLCMDYPKLIAYVLPNSAILRRLNTVPPTFRHYFVCSNFKFAFQDMHSKNPLFDIKTSAAGTSEYHFAGYLSTAEKQRLTKLQVGWASKLRVAVSDFV